MAGKTQRIMGIDPGTRHVGYGVLEQRGFELLRLDSGCIAADSGPISERLVVIYRGLREVIGRLAPDAVAVETVFTGDNPRTAIAIGEGRGVAVLAAAESGVAVAGYEPAVVKRAVAGNGRAGKEQVRSMVRVLLRLAAPPETDHEAYALDVAITHALHARLRHGAAPSAPLARLESMRRRDLPEAVARQLPAGVAVPRRRSGRRAGGR